MGTMFESLLPFLAALKRASNGPSQDDDDESDPATNQFVSAQNPLVSGSNPFLNVSNPFQSAANPFAGAAGTGSNQQEQGNAGTGTNGGTDPNTGDEAPPDMSFLPQAPLPNLFPDSPQVPLFAPSAGCTGKIENFINDGLDKANTGKSGPVVFLGPTDMSGADGETDPVNKPGWRNGAWNFNFFAPGMTSVPAKWKQGRDPKSGLHLPPPGGEDPVTPNYGPGTYNGQKGFYFTGHFDSANPLSGNPLDLFKHVFGDVLFKTPHGC